ncbi:MAG: CHAT domain-containing protein, partial [Acidobacteriota bacterium]|nr:CHAT domain-containing protein [Acidobacteriota bacterium]
IENLRAPLAADEFRMSFLAGKLAPFENLARVFITENQLKEAFLCVEKSRARSLADALDENLTLAGKTKSASNLIRKLEGLREELNWFYSRLSRAEEAEIERLQREAKRGEKQIADVMRQIESTSDAKFSAKESLDFERLQMELGAKKALIEFINFDGNLSAFIVGNEKIRFVENLARESEILSLLEGLRFQFGALRYGAENLENFMPELKRRADFYLQKLYEKLFKPLESLLENRDLIIVPSGALNYVPFSALFDGASYLIETREIVHAPSATVWQKLSAKSSKRLENALLLGFADEQIPLVEKEIKTLEKILPQTKSLIGAAATFAAYTKNAPHFDIIHLACHGQFRPENPLFSSLHLADGFVTVRDVCAQKLKAELVILSACETGLNEIFAGEEILGLARGFLSAGASSLVLSLWTVSDAATVRLMKDFYENLQRGASVAASLKAAQNNFIKQGVHPYFWSLFAVIGK